MMIVIKSTEGSLFVTPHGCSIQCDEQMKLM